MSSGQKEGKVKATMRDRGWRRHNKTGKKDQIHEKENLTRLVVTVAMVSVQ